MRWEWELRQTNRLLAHSHISLSLLAVEFQFPPSSILFNPKPQSLHWLSLSLSELNSLRLSLSDHIYKYNYGSELVFDSQSMSDSQSRSPISSSSSSSATDQVRPILQFIQTPSLLLLFTNLIASNSFFFYLTLSPIILSISDCWFFINPIFISNFINNNNNKKLLFFFFF